jgi:hypothetical protein
MNISASSIVGQPFGFITRERADPYDAAGFGRPVVTNLLRARL